MDKEKINNQQNEQKIGNNQQLTTDKMIQKENCDNQQMKQVQHDSQEMIKQMRKISIRQNFRLGKWVFKQQLHQKEIHFVKKFYKELKLKKNNFISVNILNTSIMRDWTEFLQLLRQNQCSSIGIGKIQQGNMDQQIHVQLIPPLLKNLAYSKFSVLRDIQIDQINLTNLQVFSFIDFPYLKLFRIFNKQSLNCIYSIKPLVKVYSKNIRSIRLSQTISSNYKHIQRCKYNQQDFSLFYNLWQRQDRPIQALKSINDINYIFKIQLQHNQKKFIDLLLQFFKDIVLQQKSGFMDLFIHKINNFLKKYDEYWVNYFQGMMRYYFGESDMSSQEFWDDQSNEQNQEDWNQDGPNGDTQVVQRLQNDR